ncbi:MAG: polysaccharide deacetylase family protein, partial [Defluviitaleaceae bacterium]|nr:polysaccharide deacetylase family protein [Defluviitaleaceae bacterium]
MPNGYASNMTFEPYRREMQGFVINVIYPISSSSKLNTITSGIIDGLMNDFMSKNNVGSLYVRPMVYAHDTSAIGIALDARSYGDIGGFEAGRYVVNFNLQEDIKILPDQLFARGTDYRAVFADLAGRWMRLIGDEDFNFDDENIYLHVRTHGHANSTESYTTLTFSLLQFEGMWQGIAPLDNDPRPRLAITFDDGPHYRFTPQLLDALNTRGVIGNFFVLGASATAHPDIVRRMHDEGHVVGNHSYSHSNLATMSRSRIQEELENTSARIYEITGQRPNLLRPPFGTENSEVRDVAQEMGMSIILWSIDPKDWLYLDAYAVRDNIMRHAREGSVILLHDIHETSIRGAIMAIDMLLARGYRFVGIDELYDAADLPLEAGSLYRSIYRDLVTR